MSTLFVPTTNTQSFSHRQTDTYTQANRHILNAGKEQKRKKLKKPIAPVHPKKDRKTTHSTLIITSSHHPKLRQKKTDKKQSQQQKKLHNSQATTLIQSVYLSHSDSQWNERCTQRENDWMMPMTKTGEKNLMRKKNRLSSAALATPYIYVKKKLVDGKVKCCTKNGRGEGNILVKRSCWWMREVMRRFSPWVG